MPKEYRHPTLLLLLLLMNTLKFLTLMLSRLSNSIFAFPHAVVSSYFMDIASKSVVFQIFDFAFYSLNAFFIKFYLV